MLFRFDRSRQVLPPLARFLLAPLVIVLTLSSCPLWAQGPGFEPCRFEPVDESGLDPSFKTFWDAFKAAIERKDAEFLKRHLDPDLKWSFGAEHGREAFLKYYKLDTGDPGSEMWPVLAEIIRLGGTFSDQTRNDFIAPYVYSRWPDTYDAFEYLAVTGTKVNLREQADVSSTVLGKLDYEIVRNLPNMKHIPEPETIDGETHSWYRVQSSSGQSGWVWGKFLRSSIDWRVRFERRGDTWIATFLIAGD
jgi:hypothetical protein